MTGQRPPFRRSRSRIIAGVCAGISEWLGWEPAAGRFLYVLLSVMSVGVPGIIIYAVLWTIMPRPENAPGR
jgi:phage shock protein C